MRPGGVWRFVMHGPDGRDYQNRITFEEVVPPERLVYRHGGGEDVEPVQFRQTIVFEDLGGRTRITWRGDFPSAPERDRVIKEYGADKGLVQTLARLAEYRGDASCLKEPLHGAATGCDMSAEFLQRSAQRIGTRTGQRRSVSACVRVHTGAAAASSARPAAVNTNWRPRLSALSTLILTKPRRCSGLRLAVRVVRSMASSGHVLDARRLRAIERHQQRKLALRQPERAQRVVERRANARADRWTCRQKQLSRT